MDWRHSDDRFQQRQFLMSAFVRSGIPLKSTVYEFCDHAISQGYGETLKLMDLNEVDRFVVTHYNEWVQAHKQVDS